MKCQARLAVREVVVKEVWKGQNFEERGAQSKYFWRMGARIC